MEIWSNNPEQNPHFRIVFKNELKLSQNRRESTILNKVDVNHLRDSEIAKRPIKIS